MIDRFDLKMFIDLLAIFSTQGPIQTSEDFSTRILGEFRRYVLVDLSIETLKYRNI